VFTSTALADPGNGNSANAPGQVKQQQAAPAPAPAPAPAAAPAQQPQQQAPGQAKKAATQAQAPASSHTQSQAPGQAKKATSSPSSSSGSSAGVKPANNTTHWTHCTTGTSSSGATCTSSDSGHTPQVGSDVSKRYGNGKTAAQIAVSRGGVGVQLTGPGNSQPHKVTVCGKPNNKSGGVDVHAVKSYDKSACQAQVQTPAVPTPTPPTAPCGFTVVQQQSTVGMMHVNGKGEDVHLMTNPHSAHFQGKHADDHAVVATTFTLQPDTSQTCGQQTPAQQAQQAPAQQTQVQQVTPVTAAPSQQTQQTQQAQQAATQTPAAAPASTGGVLGAQTTLGTPKPASHHGVLGTVAHVTGSSLPFTGFPVWVAILIAAALIAGGLLLRRRSVA